MLFIQAFSFLGAHLVTRMLLYSSIHTWLSSEWFGFSVYSHLLQQLFRGYHLLFLSAQLAILPLEWFNVVNTAVSVKLEIGVAAFLLVLNGTRRLICKKPVCCLLNLMLYTKLLTCNGGVISIPLNNLRHETLTFRFFQIILSVVY